MKRFNKVLFLCPMLRFTYLIVGNHLDKCYLDTQRDRHCDLKTKLSKMPDD